VIPVLGVGITKYPDIGVFAIPVPRGYVRMTEEELRKKMDIARRAADLAEDRWLNGEHHTGVTEKDLRLTEIDRQIWISLIRSYNARKGNWQRWRVDKTGHKRDG
jgi:hypothetical protein